MIRDSLDALALVDLPPPAPTTPDRCPSCRAELKRDLGGQRAIGLCSCAATWGKWRGLSRGPVPR